MRKLSLAVTFGICFAISAAAQVKPNPASNNNHTNAPTTGAAVAGGTETRERYSQPGTTVNTKGSVVQAAPGQQWGNAPLSNSVTPATPPTSVSRSATLSPGSSASLTETYRVGRGDILDIRIPESLSTRSTLYTVNDTGMIDYPMAVGPIQVSGLTTEAIAARLKANIRVIDASPIMVKVRDFSSHSVNVIGFVQSPGAKVLRREAVPLYVLLAEAAPLKDAASATVVRNGQNVAVIDLRNVAASNQLILHGDVIKVSDRPVGR